MQKVDQKISIGNCKKQIDTFVVCAVFSLSFQAVLLLFNSNL